MNLPDDFFQHDRQVLPELNVFNYEVRNSSAKNKINMNKHVLSFLTEGQKQVHFSNKSVSIDTQQSLLIASGNFLMTEQAGKGHFRCLMFFFSQANLDSFFLKHPQLVPEGKINSGADREPYFILQKDEFIIHFIDALAHSFHLQNPLSLQILRLKFEEIMLYLIDKYRDQFLNFLKSLLVDERKLSFKTIIEKNIFTNLSLEEIAFLCNMSLSTFKRQFSQIYQESPGKWLQRMRLTKAKEILSRNTVKPSEIFMDFGYENLSNFSTAFKNQFGYTPKQVRRL